MQIVWVLLAIAGSYATGRSIIIWSFLTYTFGWVALLPVVLLPTNKKRLQSRIDSIETLTKIVQENTKPKEYKDFNTVDDLMKQLETK